MRRELERPWHAPVGGGWLALASVWAAGVLAACGHGAAAPDRAAAPPAAAARVNETVEDERLVLVLSAPGAVRVGAADAASLSIEGRGEYHVNAEYPMRVLLRAGPGVALPRAELAGADAAELGAERARFELPFTCRAPGTHRIEVEVDFAVCTDVTCVPETRAIAVDLRASP